MDFAYFGLFHMVPKTIGFELQWCSARDLFGSQIPVTTGVLELRISRIRSSYLTHYAISLMA